MKQIKIKTILKNAIPESMLNNLRDKRNKLKMLIGISKLAVMGIPFSDVLEYIKEFESDDYFQNELKQKITKAKAEGFTGGNIYSDESKVVYAIVRYLKPKLFVETGVGPGRSSLVILRAMDKNGCGHLYSIDLPGYDKIYYPSLGKGSDTHVPEGWNVGWMVPDTLCSRWKLILGDSKKELPVLLKSLGQVDIFMHDSLHVWEHMMFEYKTAWPYIKNKGFLFSHDTVEYWSLAFIDYCKANKLSYSIINTLGITQKLT